MADGNSSSDGGWMAEVQRLLSIIIIATFCTMLLAMTLKVVWVGTVADNLDILKIALPAAITFAGTCLGFYYGSSKSKEQADTAQQSLMDKLTPPAAPTPPSAPVPPWWARLTDDEKTKITAEAANDARVQAFITASQVGAATKDDLQYLVTKGLLNQDRADAIAAA